MGAGESELSTRLGAIPRLDPAAPAIEFHEKWTSWGELDATSSKIAAQVERPGTQVGIVLRNSPEHVAALVGVLQAGGCVVTINPHRGRERTRADVASLALDVLVGLPGDLDDLVPEPGPRTRIALPAPGEDCVVTVNASVETCTALMPGVAVRMLTSGTTGAPKRIELGYAMFERVFQGAKHYEKDKSSDLRLRSGVAIVNAPLVHVGGVFRVLQCVNDGRSFCLLERFAVDAWRTAVLRHRPKTASLVPAALRMVLEADLDPQELSSLRSIVCGTAPLDPEDADAFFQRYGIPVLVSYGATEFGGGVAGWNLPDHERYWSTKRGSVGRAHASCELRVVGEADGRVLGEGEPGLLEVKAKQLGGREWVRTTDLARIDADGFLFILGRADQAIIRGGFKVLPETVKSALEQHPEVRGAAVVGLSDARLGAVPVAAVELRLGARVTGESLASWCADRLARYEIPVEIRLVEELPRTASGKADLSAISDLFTPEASAS